MWRFAEAVTSGDRRYFSEVPDAWDEWRVELTEVRGPGRLWKCTAFRDPHDAFAEAGLRPPEG